MQVRSLWKMSREGLALLLAGSVFCCFSTAAEVSTISPELLTARDRQDLTALTGSADKLGQAAKTNMKSADAQYQAAIAYSFASEVAMQLHDKKKAQELAEAGMPPSKQAISLAGNNAEFHRVLGNLCGQVIPASPLTGLKYGQCAREEINKAIQLNGKLALAYVSRGVGNTYLPPTFGGGVDLALQDFDKALSLDKQLTDAYLWKGVALRKANKNADARAAFEQALKLDPNRIYARQLLEKTPAQ